MTNNELMKNGSANEVYSKEELEEAKKEEMRELLVEAFDGKSVLYEIYKRRGWLDRLFTDKILSMDKEALYINKQVAEICETKDYVIKNKRRELLEYINPVIMGEGNAKSYKHNYISVFKMKMIDGLTGEGSEYTIPQLKELIYGHSGKPANKEVSNTSTNEMLMQLLKKMERFEEFEKMVKSNQFFEEIDKRIRETTMSLFLETVATKDDSVKNELESLYEKIISTETSVTEKEQLLNSFTDLETTYHEQAPTIRMYKNAAEDRIIRYKQDEREVHILKVKEKIGELLERYDTSDDKDKEEIRKQVNQLAQENPEINFEIRLWLTSLAKEKKKGFWSRLFS